MRNRFGSGHGQLVRDIVVLAAVVGGLLVWSGPLHPTGYADRLWHGIGTAVEYLCLVVAPVAIIIVVILVMRAVLRHGSDAAPQHRWGRSWRAWWWYRRRWPETMAAHGLVTTVAERTVTPRIRRVDIGDAIDTVTVRTLPGQTADEWIDRADTLAQAFDAVHAHVRVLRPGTLALDFRHLDNPADPYPQAS